MEIADFMEQARALQDKVSAAQDMLDKTIVRGIAGGGDVIVTMTGKYDLADFQIRPELLTKTPAEVTATIVAAFRDAKSKADDAIDRVMGDATAGISLP